MSTPPNIKIPRHLKKNKRGGKFSPEAISKRSKPTNHYIRFHHVKCIDCPDLHGVVITCDGFGDKEIARPLFERRDLKHSAFLEAVDPVQFVFKIIVDGKDYVNPIGIGNVANAIIVLPGRDAFEDEEPIVLDSAYCKEFFDDTLLPAMLVNATFNEGVAPIWDDTESYRTVDTWSEILKPSELFKMLKFEVVGPKSNLNLPSIEHFFKLAKANVYACYPVGKVPDEIKKEYHLASKDLDEDDWNEEWHALAAPGEQVPAGQAPANEVDVEQVPIDVSTNQCRLSCLNLTSNSQTSTFFVSKGSENVKDNVI